MKEIDCLVLGGAAAGSLLAAFLADSGLSVWVAEKRPWELGSSQYIAVSYGSWLALKSLQYPEPTAGFGEIERVHVSVEGAFGAHRIKAAEQNLAYLGRVIQLKNLEHHCRARAIRAENVVWKQPALVQEARWQGDGWWVDVAGEPIKAALVVAADGADASFAEGLGLGYREHRYEHELCIVQARWTHPHGGVAYERFLKKSTLAVLPLESHQTVCVWTLPKEEALAYRENVTALQAALASAMGERLGGVTIETKPVLLAVRQRVAQQLTGPGCVLLGNAAHALHPIAAQGFNLTIRDTLALAKALCAQVSVCGALNDPLFLSRYEQERQADQARVSWLTHQMATQLTETAWSPVLGTLGVRASCLPGLKQAIARWGLGI